MSAEDRTTPPVDPSTGADEAPVQDGPLVDAEAEAEAAETAEAAAGVELDDEVALAEDTALEAPEPDYQDLYLRSAAEMENLRKRARRDVGAAEARGIARLAKELLPALDNLDRALAHAEQIDGDSEHHLTKGIRLVQNELAAALERAGIKAEIPLGAPFDPHRHEALTQQARDNTPPGLVIEVYQPGYVYGDTVLRAAKVVVSA